jgi:exodeoxyribonuclease VII small subunit
MTEKPEPEISYEQARAELREIVQALESGGQPLEQSLALWQRGEELAALCQRWLDGARVRLDAAIEATDAAEQTAGNPAPATRGKR